MMLPKICSWLFLLSTIKSMSYAAIMNNSALPISILDLACNSQDDVFSPIVDELLGSLVAPEPNLFECDEIANGLQASPSFSLLETYSTMASLIQHFQET
jgi:hypothetical protein